MTRAGRIVAAVLLLAPVPAYAQTAAVPPERGIDLALGGTFLAPAPAGTSTASLIAPSGSRLTLFDVESRYGIGYGADAGLGFRLSPGVWLEARGSWSWTSVRSRISDDVENAPSLTITETIARVAAEGAVLWYFSASRPTSFFVRGGGGWMRELAGDNSLVEDGLIGTGGAGVRHWWRQSGTGAVKRMGLRLEGYVLFRTAGLEFGSSDVRITPAASGLLLIGF